MIHIRVHHGCLEPNQANTACELLTPFELILDFHAGAARVFEIRMYAVQSHGTLLVADLV